MSDVPTDRRANRMSRLPASWIETSLGEVAEINPRKNVTLAASDLVSFVPMAAVDEVSGRITGATDRPYREVSKGFTQFQDHDVIFAKITPSMENGKSAVARNLTNGIGIGSTEFHVFRPFGAVDPNYLWRYVRQSTFRINAQTVMSGAVGQQRVPADYLRNHAFPLPPINEQVRISEKLDHLDTRLSNARHNLDRVSALIDRYKQFFLQQAYSSNLTRGWRESNSVKHAWHNLAITEFATVGTGATPKRGVAKYYNGGNIPWVTSGAVNDDVVTQAHQAITEVALRETNCKVFPAGTIIVAMYGEGKTRGKVSVLGISAATNQAIAAIQVHSDKINSRFLFWFFKSNYLKLREQAVGGVQPNLSIGLIKALPVPIPSLEEQLEIVRRIESAFGRLDRIAADYSVAVKLLRHLDAAIHAKAFGGELIPQNPNDEPASALLERALNKKTEPSGRTRGTKTIKARDSLMAEPRLPPSDRILQDSENWPTAGLPVAEVMARNPLPHDDLRDALFDLLGGPAPKLHQEFDPITETMMIKRVAA